MTTPQPGAVGGGAVATPVDDEGRASITLSVNGRAQRVRVRAHHTLLDVLRQEIGLTGPREGCGVGMCGACTVLVDGRAVSGCLMLAVQAEGSEIVTIEGLTGADGTLHPIQEAYAEHTAFQCSYCTPGFILATKALLDEVADPSPEDVRSYLAGNLCRCGSYVKILDAVMDAKERARGDGMSDASGHLASADDGPLGSGRHRNQEDRPSVSTPT